MHIAVRRGEILAEGNCFVVGGPQTHAIVQSAIDDISDVPMDQAGRKTVRQVYIPFRHLT